MYAQRNTPQHGSSEELKNFNVSVQLAPCDQFIDSGLSSYNAIAQKFEIQPRIEQLQNNILKVSYSYNNLPILCFYLAFAKKNPNQILEVKNMNAIKRINSNVVLREDYNSIKNPTQNYMNSINYQSINHYFSFNKEKDSFMVHITIENSYFISQFQYSFFFGQFDMLDSLRVPQQQQMDVIVKTEQNDDDNNYKRLSSVLSHHLQNIDDQQSTKSNSPQQEEHQYTIGYSIPSFNYTTTATINQITTNTTAATTTPKSNAQKTTSEQMKIEENQNCAASAAASKLRQRKQSKHSSSSTNSFDESSSDQNNTKKGKFDKKNVVKNFVKAFDGYFLDPHNDQELMSLFDINCKDSLKRKRQQYEKLEKSMKYNNKMIIAIIYSEFKDIFQHFLQIEADKWISNSSVFDKEAHKAILRDYIRAAENPRDIPKIVNLRIRNRDSNIQYYG